MKQSTSKLLIKNATLLMLSNQKTATTGDILTENGVITKIAPGISENVTETVDATGLLAMPGFVQTHVHLCQTLFRNLANDLELLDWLRNRIWPLEAAHNRSSLAISARLGILEMIKSGITTVFDMGSLFYTDAILEEVAKSGLRSIVGVTFMDNKSSASGKLYRPAKDSFLEFERLYSQWQSAESGRIGLSLAPRFALSCSKKLLQQIAAISGQKNLLIHTHASENIKEVEFIKNKYGVGNVTFYHQLGLTGPNACLAHCIWLDESEVEILAETGSRVLHCPSANLKLGSGIANIPNLLQKGITCSLGSDGAACNNNLNMFWEMRLAGLIQKPIHGSMAMPANTLLEMATIHGAHTIHLEQQIGTLQVGKKADVVLLDLRQAHSMPFAEDVYSALVYSANPENVDSVFVAGQPVMRNRKVLTIDETETIRKADEELNGLLKRAELKK